MDEQPLPPPPLQCARCGRELRRGVGDFYAVRVEAVSDPTPPAFTPEDLAADIEAEIRRLLARLEGVSEREAMDQVYRRLTFCICVPCYKRWIEDPTGKEG